MMGPETVCLVHMEPVQNSGGSFVAPEGYWRGVRELCDRYDILLSADEVITGFGRIGAWFALRALDIRPDLITSAKGLSSSYGAIGAVITHRPGRRALPRGRVDVHARDHLRRAPRPVRRRPEERRDHEAREASSSTCASTRTSSAGSWRRSSTSRSSATSAAPGSSTRSSSSRTRARRRRSQAEECEDLLRGYLSQAFFDAGLICRADDRGDPVVQISPPLVATEREMDEIVGILGDGPRRGAAADALTRRVFAKRGCDREAGAFRGVPRAGGAGIERRIRLCRILLGVQIRARRAGR